MQLQDFFAQPGAFGMDARQDLAFSMGAGHMGATQFQQVSPGGFYVLSS